MGNYKEMHRLKINVQQLIENLGVVELVNLHNACYDRNTVIGDHIYKNDPESLVELLGVKDFVTGIEVAGIKNEDNPEGYTSFDPYVIIDNEKYHNIQDLPPCISSYSEEDVLQIINVEEIAGEIVYGLEYGDFEWFKDFIDIDKLRNLY